VTDAGPTDTYKVKSMVFVNETFSDIAEKFFKHLKILPDNVGATTLHEYMKHIKKKQSSGKTIVAS